MDKQYFNTEIAADLGVSFRKRDTLETYAISSAPPLEWSNNLKWYESH